MHLTLHFYSFFCHSRTDAFIDKSQRPKDYGGDDDTPLGQAPQHQAFLELPRLWDEADSDRDRANTASRSHGQGLGSGVAVGQGLGPRDHPGVKQSNPSNHQSNPRTSSSPRNKQLTAPSTHGLPMPIPIHTAVDISQPPTAKTRNASPSSPSSSSSSSSGIIPLPASSIDAAFSSFSSSFVSSSSSPSSSSFSSSLSSSSYLFLSGLFGWMRGGNHQSSGQPQQVRN